MAQPHENVWYLSEVNELRLSDDWPDFGQSAFGAYDWIELGQYDKTLVLDNGVSGENARNVAFERIDDTKILIVWIDTALSPDEIRAVVYDHSTHTKGTPVTIESAAGSDIFLNHITSLTKCDDNNYVVSYELGPTNNFDLKAAVLQISGTTITVGTPLVVEAASGTGKIWSLALDSTRILSMYETGSPNNVECVILSRSGTTLTANTPVTIGTNEELQAQSANPLVLIDTDKVLALVTPGGSTDVYVLTISGTTITVGNSDTTAAPGVQNKPCLGFLDTDKALLTVNGNIYVVTISGTTPTINSPDNFSTSGGDVLMTNVISPQVDRAVVFFTSTELGGAQYSFMCSVSISGTTITAETRIPFEVDDVSTDDILVKKRGSNRNDDQLIVLFDDANDLYLRKISPPR